MKIALLAVMMIGFIILLILASKCTYIEDEKYETVKKIPFVAAMAWLVVSVIICWKMFNILYIFIFVIIYALTTVSSAKHYYKKALKEKS